MEEPKFVIPAEAHTDDRNVEVKFDALAWFRQASAYNIARLAACGWGGDYPADEVAEFTAELNPDVKRIYDYLALVNKPGRDTIGFECRIDSEAAMKWMASRDKLGRPPINRGAKMVYRHTLHDNSEQKGTAEIVFEADAAWASIAVWNNGEHLADVTVELYEGQIVARTWKTEDLDGDPTTRTDLCANPDKPSDATT